MVHHQRVSDPGHERRYFTMVPHIVTDMVGQGLTPTALALYLYYRRQCGETGGEFTESVRSTADKIGISHGSVHTARGMLVEHALIDLHLEGPEGHEVAVITIRDVWPENMTKYAPAEPDKPLRPNIGRKSRREPRVASGLASKNLGVGVRDCVQILNAPIPFPEKPEEPEKQEKHAREIARPRDEKNGDARCALCPSEYAPYTLGDGTPVCLRCSYMQASSATPVQASTNVQ